MFLYQHTKQRLSIKVTAAIAVFLSIFWGATLRSSENQSDTAALQVEQLEALIGTEAVEPSLAATAESTDPVSNVLETVVSDWKTICPKIQELKTAQSQPDQKYHVSKPQQDPASLDSYLNQAPTDVSDLPVAGAPGPDASFSPPTLHTDTSAAAAAPSPADRNVLQNTVDYSLINENEIPMDDNDIMIKNANVNLPTGEGCEAQVSANVVGLLTHLGCEVLDDQGVPLKDERGEPVLTPWKKGMSVKKGQFLGKQRDTEFVARKIVAQRQQLVAEKEASKVLEIEVAEKALLVAKADYERVKNANTRFAGAITEEEVMQKAFEFARAGKSLDKAKYDLDIKKDEVDVSKAQVIVADAQIEDRKIVSPIDGLIDDIAQNEGQWLHEGDPVLKIVRLDKVQVAARIPASQYTPDMIDGCNVTVYVQKPGKPLQQIEGKITYVRQIIEAGQYFFTSDITNQCDEKGTWLLNPGAIVTMVIHRD